MVKTTYALTLFAAVSLAAPVQQLNGRATTEGSSEHKNLIADIPIIGSMLAAVCNCNSKKVSIRDRGIIPNSQCYMHRSTTHALLTIAWASVPALDSTTDRTMVKTLVRTLVKTLAKMLARMEASTGSAIWPVA